MSDFVEFELRPLDEVAAWGESGSQSLSWFGFTDGRYRLRFGDQFLLDYSAELVAKSNPAFTDFAGSWVDYQVVRLWEDLLYIVPNVLQPVPKELLPFVRLTHQEWRHWFERALDWAEADDDAAVDLVFEFGCWRDGGKLDCGYLQAAPGIWFWRIEDTVEVRWDNTGLELDEVRAWSATQGEHQMSVSEFTAGVRAFHNEFLFAMGDRVRAVCEGWDRPKVAVDFDHLRAEQVDRAGWLDNALLRKPEFAAADAVTIAASVIAAVGHPV